MHPDMLQTSSRTWCGVKVRSGWNYSQTGERRPIASVSGRVCLIRRQRGNKTSNITAWGVVLGAHQGLFCRFPNETNPVISQKFSQKSERRTNASVSVCASQTKRSRAGESRNITVWGKGLWSHHTESLWVTGRRTSSVRVSSLDVIPVWHASPRVCVCVCVWCVCVKWHMLSCIHHSFNVNFGP